jgi:hypothetical protein
MSRRFALIVRRAAQLDHVRDLLLDIYSAIAFVKEDNRRFLPGAYYFSLLSYLHSCTIQHIFCPFNYDLASRRPHSIPTVK